LKNEKYPNLVASLKAYFQAHNIKNCILDGEIVAIDKSGNIKTFFELQLRKKKASSSSPLNASE